MYLTTICHLLFPSLTQINWVKLSRVCKDFHIVFTENYNILLPKIDGDILEYKKYLLLKINRGCNIYKWIANSLDPISEIKFMLMVDLCFNNRHEILENMKSNGFNFLKKRKNQYSVEEFVISKF